MATRVDIDVHRNNLLARNRQQTSANRQSFQEEIARNEAGEEGASLRKKAKEKTQMVEKESDFTGTAPYIPDPAANKSGFELAAYKIEFTQQGAGERNLAYTISSAEGQSLQVSAFLSGLSEGIPLNNNRVTIDGLDIRRIYDYNILRHITIGASIALPLSGEKCVLLVHSYGRSTTAHIAFDILFSLGDFEEIDGAAYPPDCGSQGTQGWSHETFSRYKHYTVDGTTPTVELIEDEIRQEVAAYLIDRNRVQRIPNATSAELQARLQNFMYSAGLVTPGAYSKTRTLKLSPDGMFSTDFQQAQSYAALPEGAPPSFGSTVEITPANGGLEYIWAETPILSGVYERVYSTVEFYALNDATEPSYLWDSTEGYQTYLAALSNYPANPEDKVPYPNLTSVSNEIPSVWKQLSSWQCVDQILDETESTNVGSYKTIKQRGGVTGLADYSTGSVTIPWLPEGDDIDPDDFYKGRFESVVACTVPSVPLYGATPTGKALSDWESSDLSFLCGDRLQNLSTAGVYTFLSSPNYDNNLTVSELVAVYFSQSNAPVPNKTLGVVYENNAWTVYSAPGQHITLTNLQNNTQLEGTRRVRSYPYPSDMHFVWDWGKPQYCRQKLLDLGFTDNDLEFVE